MNYCIGLTKNFCTNLYLSVEVLFFKVSSTVAAPRAFNYAASDSWRLFLGLTGEGDVFLKAGGTLIRKDLDEGQELRISSGCLVGFSQGVDYDVRVIKGFQNVIAGGEGLFMTTLTGPGTVWLQGQPAQR